MDGLSFEVRRAMRGDALTLARMRADSAAERQATGRAERRSYEQACAEFFIAEFESPNSFLYSWVAIRHQAVVGAASLTIVRTLPRLGSPFNGVDGRVRDVYVVPEHRRIGIAKELMRHAMAEAKILSVDRLTLGSSELGRPLYESLGFVAKRDEMVYDSHPC